MIVLVLVVAVVVGIIATYVVEARRRRNNRRLARSVHDLQSKTRADGIDSPTAAEGVLRGGYAPDPGGGGWVQ